MLLTQLPPETIHNILRHVDPDDLPNVAQTCRALYNFVVDNNPLCREIYLREFDAFSNGTAARQSESSGSEQQQQQQQQQINYARELADLYKLKRLCSPTSKIEDEKRKAELPFVRDVVVRFLKRAVQTQYGGDSTTVRESRSSRSKTYPVSKNAEWLTTLFASSTAREAFLCRSFLWERARALAVEGKRPVRGERKSEGEVSEKKEDGEEKDNGEGSSSSQESMTRTGSNEMSPNCTCRRRSARNKSPKVLRRSEDPEVQAVYQASAHLHCLYGCSLASAVAPAVSIPICVHGRVVGRRIGASGGRGLYALACSKVYDLREYTPGTRWGPFLEQDDLTEGPKVDWEKVEAILIVLGTNIRHKGLEGWPIFQNFWGKPFAGVWPGSYIPWWKGKDKEEDRRELERTDPYGVSGSWLRVVCFLDYSDFFAFNFPWRDNLPNDVPRPPIGVGEAMRLILMRTRVSRIEPPGPSDHPDYPVVHFVGFSRALDGSWDDNADADLRGTVRMTPEGEVWWTSYSIYNGEERWKSEGIQLGGIRSARGVVGNWFDKDYDPNGPCGPTAWWKVSDRVAKGEELQGTFLEDLLPIIVDDAMAEYEHEGHEGDPDFEDEVFLEHGIDIGLHWGFDDGFGEDFDDTFGDEEHAWDLGYFDHGSFFDYMGGDLGDEEDGHEHEEDEEDEDEGDGW